MSDLFSISEAAEVCGVHIETLKKWEQRGWLFPHYTKGGHRRYRRSEIEAKMTLWNNPFTYIFHFDTLRQLPRIVKIMGSAQVGEEHGCAIWLGSGDEVTGYALLELGVYNRILSYDVPLVTHWHKIILLKDKSRNSPIHISNSGLIYTEYKLEDGYVENMGWTLPNYTLHLSMYEIWKNDKQLGLEVQRMAVPEMIWGKEYNAEDSTLRYVGYRRTN